MLAAAREDGVVRIRVGAKGAAQVALERALIARFGLADAIVAPAPQDEASVADVVGAAAATWLGEHVRDGCPREPPPERTLDDTKSPGFRASAGRRGAGARAPKTRGRR